MKRPIILILFIVSVSWTFLCSAQKDFTGRVTGHVVASDTQQPMRFIDVLLYRKPPAPTATKLKGFSEPKKTLQQAQANVDVYQTKSNRDGIYFVDHIPSGDYYVLGSAPGYLQPKSIFQRAYNFSSDPKVIDQNLSLIHVSAQVQSQADISLQRGGAISGTLRFGDGMAASNVTVILAAAGDPPVQLPDNVYSMIAASSAPDEGLHATSDDLGHYRIAGVPDGRYVVQAAVMTFTQAAVHNGELDRGALGADYPLMVYAPNSFHKADAEAFTLKAPEERVDEDLTVSLDKLYSIAGQVVSATDHEGVAAGTIWLMDAKDKSLTRSTEVDSRGNFVLAFVPQGTYEIGTDASARFQEGSQTVIVTDSDVTVPAMALVPVKTAPK